MDTTLFDDGEVTVEAYFRTAEESAAGTELALLVNKTKKCASIKNNLVSEEAIVRLYDESGALFSAPVYVTDPQTGTLVDITGSSEDDTLPETVDEIDGLFLDYENTYMLKYDWNTQGSREINAVFAHQSRFTFALSDPEGEAHPNAVYAVFEKSTKSCVNKLKTSVSDFRIQSREQYIVYSAWIAVTDFDQRFMQEYSYWEGAGENVARYELDPTQLHEGVIALTAEYEPLYRLSRTTTELSTNIKSVKEQKDGSYLVRLSQKNAWYYDSVISLPEGAYNVRLNNEEISESDIVLATTAPLATANISFQISKEALAQEFVPNADTVARTRAARLLVQQRQNVLTAARNTVRLAAILTVR